MTDGAINTGSSFTILTGQSTITSVSALQHVAYTSNPDGLEVDFLYVFGTDTTGNQYFGVAQVPALRSSQDEVAAALGNLQVCRLNFLPLMLKKQVRFGDPRKVQSIIEKSKAFQKEPTVCFSLYEPSKSRFFDLHYVILPFFSIAMLKNQ